MIRKRATTPGKQSRGRHPMLKPGSAWSVIYSFIQLHPGATREDITRMLGMQTNRVTGRVADLINEGLIRVAGWKQSPFTHKRIQQLEVSGCNLAGNRNDRLKLDIEIYCDANGNYRAVVKLRGADSDRLPSGPSVLCLKKTVGLTVTPPAKLQTSAKDTGGLTIDGNYKIVE